MLEYPIHCGLGDLPCNLPQSIGHTCRPICHTQRIRRKNSRIGGIQPVFTLIFRCAVKMDDNIVHEGLVIAEGHSFLTLVLARSRRDGNFNQRGFHRSGRFRLVHQSVNQFSQTVWQLNVITNGGNQIVTRLRIKVQQAIYGKKISHENSAG